MVTCSLLSAVALVQVQCSHAAHVVRIAHQFAAWCVQADFAAVASHPAALGFTWTWSFPFLARAVIVIDTVVILAQHREVRWYGVPAILVCVDVVILVYIGRHIVVMPMVVYVICNSLVQILFTATTVH